MGTGYRGDMYKWDSANQFWDRSWPMHNWRCGGAWTYQISDRKINKMAIFDNRIVLKPESHLLRYFHLVSMFLRTRHKSGRTSVKSLHFNIKLYIQHSITKMLAKCVFSCHWIYKIKRSTKKAKTERYRNTILHCWSEGCNRQDDFQPCIIKGKF